MCDTALGAYGAEQTNRSSSKYEVRGARQMRRQCAMPSMAHPALGTSCAVVLGALAAAHVLVRCPVFGVAFTEFAILLT